LEHNVKLGLGSGVVVVFAFRDILLSVTNFLKGCWLCAKTFSVNILSSMYVFSGMWCRDALGLLLKKKL